MKRVILDTNFLISLAEFKVDLDEIENILNEPYEILTISSVVDELKKINNKNARLALKLIELKKVKILKVGEKNADKAILSLANKDTIIATNDAELRKRLKTLNSKTIYLRAKKYLAID
ncbi:MAG: type II toxin-antitoxin system VapC family toxin [Candidatus Heimdallarchaeota archaeon]